jgi:hypothetical protein
MKLLESTAATYRSPKLSASSGARLRPWLLAWLGLPCPASDFLRQLKLGLWPELKESDEPTTGQAG